MGQSEDSVAGGGAAVATLGHGNRSIAELVELVQAAGIGRVVDVRSYPRSRRFPWFARDALAASLAEAGVAYEWRGRELGGRRAARAAETGRHPALDPGPAAFAAHMATRRFRAAAATLAGEAASRPHATALLCAERDPARCHRWLVADHLELIDAVAVHHWTAPGTRARHAPSAAARVTEAGELRYDRGCSADLWSAP